MSTSDQIIDQELGVDIEKEEVEIGEVSRFIILSIFTFGLYQMWWMYKSWKFFKEKEDLDIMPVWRAIFAIFFVSSLFSKCLRMAQSNGYEKSYPAGALAVGFIILGFLSRLPDPFWLISFLSVLFMIQPVSAFNYAIENSTKFRATSTGFQLRHIILLLAGGALWILMLIGLFYPQL
jgi:hypothetical protein